MGIRNKTSNMPLVSILINNYNYAHYLREAINSALDQTYPNVEVIVVDDGSTDNSRAIISEFDGQIIPILKTNGGQASAFNAGFAASNGEVICFLDSDDMFLPNKVAEIVKAMRSDHIRWCFHRNAWINNKEIYKRLDGLTKLANNSSSRTKPLEIDFRSQIRKAKFPKFAPSTSGLCFKRSLLQKILPLPVAEDVYVSDLYMKYASIALSKGCVLNKKLAIQRLHERNLHKPKDEYKKQKRRIKIDIATSYWMRIKSPELQQFAGKLLARGIGASLAIRNTQVQDKELIRKHLAMIPFLDKIKLFFMIIYYHFKLKNRTLYRSQK